jgi:hypothetical protein
MVFMKFNNNAHGIDVFGGSTKESILADTNNGSHFGDLILIPDTAQEITEQDARDMGLDPEMIDSAIESINKGEPSFYLGTISIV